MFVSKECGVRRECIVWIVTVRDIYFYCVSCSSWLADLMAYLLAYLLADWWIGVWIKLSIRIVWKTYVCEKRSSDWKLSQRVSESCESVRQLFCLMFDVCCPCAALQPLTLPLSLCLYISAFISLPFCWSLGLDWVLTPDFWLLTLNNDLSHELESRCAVPVRGGKHCKRCTAGPIDYWPLFACLAFLSLCRCKQSRLRGLSTVTLLLYNSGIIA